MKLRSKNIQPPYYFWLTGKMDPLSGEILSLLTESGLVLLLISAYYLSSKP